MKVLISNAYSRHNKGDAAILSAMIQEVDLRFPASEIVISTMDPVDEGETFDDRAEMITSPFYEAVYRRRSAPRRVLRTVVVVAMTFVWTTVRRLGLRPPGLPFEKGLDRFLNTVDEADVILAAGGGYLQADGSLRSGVSLLLHLQSLWIAGALGKPVCLVAQSIGPFSNRVLRWVARRSLNRVDLVIAREEITLNVLREMGVRQDTVHRAADLAFLFDSDQRDSMSDYLTLVGGDVDAPKVCITARRCLPERLQRRFEEALAVFADVLVADGFQVVFVPQCTSELHNDDDRVVEERIMKRMKASHRALLIREMLDHRQTRGLYENMAFVVATRMHSAIFALTAMVPTLALAYEFKTNGVMDELGLGEWVIPVEEASPEILCGAFARLRQSREQYLEGLPSGLERCRDDARRSMRLVEDLISAEERKEGESASGSDLRAEDR